MTDRFEPIPLGTLLKMILHELRTRKSVFGIPRELFYIPARNTQFATRIFGQSLYSPLGVAAGPHSQMAQNIVGAWLMGARYIELKTIQTLDELEIAKPCIDMQDEGYNCEWSQELKIKESYNEYLNAWILIHVLHHELGLKKGTGTVFNMSAGYNLEGIMKKNVQWFFAKMNNCSTELKQKIKEIKPIYPAVTTIHIPERISDNITLSTMHGCPAGEIESIARYLMEKKGLHTFVKLNPTLLGPETLRSILNKEMKYKTHVPDIAFEHDLKYQDALRIIHSLEKTAKKKGLYFGLKLTNTLESVNNKNVFPAGVDMMYMSGRALHPVSVNLAQKLRKDIPETIPMSFSAGADCFNFAELLSCGFTTVTVCSDILKPGGYMRLRQYFTEAGDAFLKKEAKSIDEFIRHTAGKKNVLRAAESNLKQYAASVLKDARYHRNYLRDLDIKTSRSLGFFDCISAPCKDTCATHQDIPGYMFQTGKENFSKAYEVILRTNPFPAITGMVCDHLCQNKCTRVNYDHSLLIREVKRFVSEQPQAQFKAVEKNGIRVAVVGAGPAGMSCAYYLALAGFSVDVFEANSRAGGMVQYAIPGFRLTDEAIEKDLARVSELGVKIHFNRRIDKTAFATLQKKYAYIYLGPGAPLSVKLSMEGMDAAGVLDPLQFLFDAKKGTETGAGKNMVIIGGGNTAMDAARTAYRLGGKNGKVTVVYRRTINEMPADQGEIKAVLEEGMEIMELTAPEKIVTEKGRVKGILCSRMELKGIDSSGRPKPEKIHGSHFVIPCDTVIPALGQSVSVDFLNCGEEKSDTITYKTSLKNVFIGGDALRGGATAIKAIGDGRKAAAQIMVEAGVKTAGFPFREEKRMTLRELMLKRARRMEPAKTYELPMDQRRTFKLISKTLKQKDAVYEASRCLYCDEVCNICTTVCPNFANRCYEIKPLRFALQKIRIRNGKTEIVKDRVYEVNQPYQIINIANFCNECGNCNTFCPTSSAPYKEKPKFFLTKESFEQASEGFFLDKETLYWKKDGDMLSLQTKKNDLVFSSGFVTVRMNKDSMQVSHVKLKKKKVLEIPLHDAAVMVVLLNGIRNVLPN